MRSLSAAMFVYVFQDLETSIKGDGIPELYDEEESVSSVQSETWFKNSQRPSYDEPSAVEAVRDFFDDIYMSI